MTVTVSEEKNESAQSICDAAWRTVEEIPLIFSWHGRPRHPVVQFTRGVLKLPEDHWIGVVQALSEGRWRKVSKPLAYIHTIAIRETKRRHRENLRGTYAGEGKRPIFGSDPIPESEKSGRCWVLMEKGRWLDEPRSIPAPVARRVVLGKMIPDASFVCLPEASKDNDGAPTLCDKWNFREWLDSERAWENDIDWVDVCGTSGLDQDERSLLWVTLYPRDDATPRAVLGWDSARLQNARKRLQRKRAAIKTAINRCR
ncbi:MAG: hypothetical protein WCB12_01320 [Bryobacteraceae bacterium]